MTSLGIPQRARERIARLIYDHLGSTETGAEHHIGNGVFIRYARNLDADGFGLLAYTKRAAPLNSDLILIHAALSAALAEWGDVPYTVTRGPRQRRETRELGKPVTIVGYRFTWAEVPEAEQAKLFEVEPPSTGGYTES